MVRSDGRAIRAFSNKDLRLEPHEVAGTDVVLLGHSMGGLLAAEVVLLPPDPLNAPQALRHRILGVVNFDVPFLGMHPGVIKSGLASLFRGKNDDTQADANGASLTSTSTTTLGTDSDVSSLSTHYGRQDTLFSPPLDPNFNPRYDNDSSLPVRKGWRSLQAFRQQAFRQYHPSYQAVHLLDSRVRRCDSRLPGIEGPLR